MSLPTRIEIPTTPKTATARVRMRAVPPAPLVAALARTGDWSEANRSRRYPGGDGHALPPALRRASSFHCPRPRRYEYDRAAPPSYALDDPAQLPGTCPGARGDTASCSGLPVPVAALVVRAQEIGAEVVPGIVPDGVDVVGVVLRIVELDQHGRPVDAVVVGMPWIDRPGPREVNALDARLPDPAEMLIGQVGTHVARVLLDELHEELPLGRRQIDRGQAHLGREALRAPGPRDDVAERLRRDGHAPALGRVHALGQPSTQILLVREGPQALEGPRAHLRRVCTE